MESYNFDFINSDNLYLKKLKKEFNYYNQITLLNNDIQKVDWLCNWVHHQLYYLPGGNECEFLDPLNIINTAKLQKKGFRCIEFAIVLNGVLNSIGLTSRIVSLHKKSIEKLIFGATHAVVEVFIKDINKWVMADPAYNTIIYKDGNPQNCYEISESIQNKRKLTVNNKSISSEHYLKDMSKYMYYFQTYLNNNQFISCFEEDSCSVMYTPDNYYPKIYQRVYTLKNIIYITDIDKFYPIPGE